MADFLNAWPIGFGWELSRASHCREGRKPMKLAVSLAALAVVLMTSSGLAKDPKTDSSTTNAKPTAANAAAFIARAEKELFDYSGDASRVAWVNATYITDEIGRAHV